MKLLWSQKMIMLYNKAFILSVYLLLTTNCSSFKDNTYSLNYNKTTVNISNLNSSGLLYDVIKGDNVIVENSPLGIIVNSDTLGIHSKIIDKKIGKENFEYSLAFSDNKISYKANTLRLTVEEPNNLIWYLIFHVSAEGVAYRYEVPGGEEIRTVNGELSSFKLPNDTKVWFFERNNNWKLKSHAGEWISTSIEKMPTISSQGAVQGLTLTCELPNGGYALLSEAGLYNYSALRLEAVGDNVLKANFTEETEGFKVKGVIKSPWRCILLSNTLNDLVNNKMVPSLNPSPDIHLFSDFSWIKPGKSVWRWWSRGTGTLEEEKIMIDDAVNLGATYSMVDEGWEKWSNKWNAVKELCKYAENKGIGVFLWKHSKEINLPENDFEVMRFFLDSIKIVGAKGVKVDFMNGHDKDIIHFEHRLLKMAAQRKLMVNFHGCHQSTGEYRTFPNEITREGVRGVELNLMAEGPITSKHNAALPFTRFVCGPADYTPLAFTNPGETTWAHQLATLVCLYSPFQCIAEDPKFLLENENVSPAINFLKKLPATWDETIVFPESKIGELVIIARRKDKDWYVGIMNSGFPKDIKIDTGFLSDCNYQVELFTDDIGKTVKIDESFMPKRKNFHKEITNPEPFKFDFINKSDCENQLIRVDKNGGAVIWFKSLEYK